MRASIFTKYCGVELSPAPQHPSQLSWVVSRRVGFLRPLTVKRAFWKELGNLTGAVPSGRTKLKRDTFTKTHANKEESF